VNLVVDEVDHVWGLGLGLGRCELLTKVRSSRKRGSCDRDRFGKPSRTTR
jgi:hypothetical protein